MRSLLGSRDGGFCDGVRRRHLLQAGVLGLAGLSLPDVLRLRAAHAAQARTVAPDTAVIYCLMSGGPSQFETYDPKPQAPAEIRGDFQPIDTRIPGVQFCELMAHQAEVADKLAIVRSVHHPSTQHSSSVHLMQTGYYCRPEATENEMPSVGSIAARVRGAVRPGLPPYVALPNEVRYNGALWVGKGHDPFPVGVEPQEPQFQIPNLTLLDGLPSDRLADRRRLLSGLDRAQRILDPRGSADALDHFTIKAFEMVTGDAARQAFDIHQEHPRLRDKYGRNPVGQRMLLARRLVEHGVTFVTLGTIGWDHHGDLVNDMKRFVPWYDQGIAALIADLHDRGLAERVLTVALGEFGRTPQISTINGLPPGRDHWGAASSVLMAGGGIRGGQVLGATDKHGAEPTSHPYRLESVLATMYRHLGIDPSEAFVDYNGRPRHILEIREPITELT